MSGDVTEVRRWLAQKEPVFNLVGDVATASWSRGGKSYVTASKKASQTDLIRYQAATPLGLLTCELFLSQGSSFLATLGFKPESRWDSSLEFPKRTRFISAFTT